MRRDCCWFGIGLLTLALAVPGRAEDGPTKPGPEQVEFFEANVRPILVTHCLGCHGPEKQKGNLRLDSSDAMRTGGDGGPAVAPGDPEQSPLIEVIRYDGPTQMPPKGKLGDVEIAALTEWVKTGAHWPTTGAEVGTTPTAKEWTITDEDRAFWAFRPVQEPPAPAVNDAAWARSPIDRFVLARLEEKGLRPAPSADKVTLIRRATFDLIGLPPTPEEVEAFLADTSAEALARVVDRLLASPHYGERWGRHWLDIARYGEDQAHSFKPRLYPNGFQYRDWVAAALNADMPYDQFVLEQIAGDLLPDEPGRRLRRLPALGYFALGPVYYGDKNQFDQIDDRIDTLTRGFLGLTVACARCHDHKYDPIPTADYYALAGVFAGTEYEEAPFAPPDQVEVYKKAQVAIGSKGREIDAWLKAESARLVEARAREVARYLVAAWKMKTLRQACDLEGSPEEVAGQEGLDPALLKRWAAYLDATREKGKATPPIAPWSGWIARLKQVPEGGADDASLHEVEQAAGAFQEHVLTLLARREGRAAEVEKAGGEGVGGQKADSDKSGLDGESKALLDDLFGAKGVMGVPKERVEKLLPDDSRARLMAMRSEMERMKKAAPPSYPAVHTLKDGKSTKAMTVLIRGNPETPGPEAPRRFLSILGGTPFAAGSGRLELARAVASPDNPLTARVMVNRLWQFHFGRGLVGTPSNFGKLGERPTHPELLDHLAHRFVAEGWSLKAMHRAIMLSATYGQGSRYDDHASEIDPENTLLWRMNRRRLEIEAWRDAMLAVSGRLDPTVGGPSQSLDDPGNRRRTYYAAVSRHDLSPLLRLFDFPDPNISSGERTRTTVPLQGLVVLNSEFMVQNAKALAARLRSGPVADDASRIRLAYRLLFGRDPGEPQVRLGLAFLGAPDAEDAASGDLTRLERYAHALLASNEFAFVD